MKYENRTDLPDHIVRSVIEWVRERMNEHARRANILVTYRAHSRSLSGLARAMAWTGGRRTKGFPQTEPIIHVFVGPFWKKITYPYSETYKKRAGALVYNSFEEHLVALVSHELRHIEQYAEITAAQAPGQSRRDARREFGSLEVDAERWARFMISEYRKAPLPLLVEMAEAAKSLPTKMCPKCGKEREIASGFGYRKVNGKTIPQSYCHICRRSHRRY